MSSTTYKQTTRVETRATSAPQTRTTVVRSGTSRHSSGMANCGWLWSIIWALILLVIGWPIGILCGILYAIFCAFVPCCSGCGDLANFLHRGLELPKTCATNMVSQRSGC